MNEKLVFLKPAVAHERLINYNCIILGDENNTKKPTHQAVMDFPPPNFSSLIPCNDYDAGRQRAGLFHKGGA